MSGPARSSMAPRAAALNAASRRLWRWPSASVDRRCARRITELRPGRRNGSQPNKETSLWPSHFAELDARNCEQGAIPRRLAAMRSAGFLAKTDCVDWDMLAHYTAHVAAGARRLKRYEQKSAGRSIFIVRAGSGAGAQSLSPLRGSRGARAPLEPFRAATGKRRA